MRKRFLGCTLSPLPTVARHWFLPLPGSVVPRLNRIPSEGGPRRGPRSRLLSPGAVLRKFTGRCFFFILSGICFDTPFETNLLW